MFTEDKVFNLKFALAATFTEGYEGDEDDYFWMKEWERTIKPEIIKKVFQELRSYPGWTVHVRNRGRSPEDEVEIVLEKVYSDGSPS